MTSFVIKLAAVTTSIGHFICDHDTRGLICNGSVLILEGERSTGLRSRALASL